MDELTMKSLRRKLGFSQAEMGLVLGSPWSYVSYMERKSADVRTNQQHQAHLIAVELLGELGLITELKRRVIAAHIGYHGRINGASQPRVKRQYKPTLL